MIKLYLGLLFFPFYLLSASLSLKLFLHNPPYEVQDFYLLKFAMSSSCKSFEEIASTNQCFITTNSCNILLEHILPLASLPQGHTILYIHSLKTLHQLPQDLSQAGNDLHHLSSYKKIDIEHAYKTLKPTITIIPIHLKKTLTTIAEKYSSPHSFLALFYPSSSSAKNFTVILPHSLYKKEKHQLSVHFLLKNLTQNKKGTILLKKTKTAFFDCNLKLQEHSIPFSPEDMVIAIGKSESVLKKNFGKIFETLEKNQISTTLHTPKTLDLKKALANSKKQLHLFLPEKASFNHSIVKELKEYFKKNPHKKIFVSYYADISSQKWNLYHYHSDHGSALIATEGLQRLSKDKDISLDILGGHCAECYLLKKLP